MTIVLGSDRRRANSLVTAALLSVGVPIQDPLVAKSLAYLLKHAQDDGGHLCQRFTPPKLRLMYRLGRSFESQQDAKYTEQLKKLEAFVKKQQWDEGENQSRAMLSMAGLVMARRRVPICRTPVSWLKPCMNSVAMAKTKRSASLIFVTRCQNLESPQNTTPAATKVNDGGFFYTTAKRRRKHGRHRRERRLAQFTVR